MSILTPHAEIGRPTALTIGTARTSSFSMTADARTHARATDDHVSPAVVTIPSEDVAMHLLAQVSAWLADVALSNWVRDEVDGAA